MIHIIQQNAQKTASQSLAGIKKSLDISARNLQELEHPDSVSQRVVTTHSSSQRVDYKIVEMVDETLLNSARSTLLSEREASVKLETLQSIETLFGEKGDLTSFAHLGDSLSNTLHELAACSRETFSPIKAKTFLELDRFLGSIKNFSTNIEQVRRQSDEKISESLQAINNILKQIAQFNKDVSTRKDEDFTAVQAQRENLNALAEHAGFYVHKEHDGSLTLYTDQSGQFNLVKGSLAATFLYTPPTSYEFGTNFNEINLSYNGSIVTLQNGSTNLTNYLSSMKGSLGAHIYLRDTLANSLNNQINKVAANMYESFNEIHNEGVSTVLRKEIIGSGIKNSDIIDVANISGNIRFCLMDSTLKLAPGTQAKDIDLSGFSSFLNGAPATVSNFANFLNAQFASGTPIGISATVQNNQLRLVAQDGVNGIVIGENVSTPSILKLNGPLEEKSFSHFFGLNNLFSNDLTFQDPNFAKNLSLRSDIAQTQGNALAVGRISMNNPLPHNQPIIKGTDIAEKLSDLWKNQEFQFSQTDTLSAKQVSLSNYVKSMITNHSEMVVSQKKVHDIAKLQHERTSALAGKASKLDKDDIENMMSELAIYQQSIMHLMKIALAMRAELNELNRR